MQGIRTVLVGTLLLNYEVVSELAEELLVGQSIQVAHHAVVVHDLEL